MKEQFGCNVHLLNATTVRGKEKVDFMAAELIFRIVLNNTHVEVDWRLPSLPYLYCMYARDRLQQSHGKIKDDGRTCIHYIHVT